MNFKTNLLWTITPSIASKPFCSFGDDYFKEVLIKEEEAVRDNLWEQAKELLGT